MHLEANNISCDSQFTRNETAYPRHRACGGREYIASDQVLDSALIRADRREILRAIVLACTTPLVAARCISGCALRRASAATDLSPPAIAISTFLMKVRIRDLRAWLRSVRRSVWRMRLRAEAVLAMGALQSARGCVRRMTRPTRQGASSRQAARLSQEIERSDSAITWLCTG